MSTTNNCRVCGQQFSGRRDAKSCSPRCRKRLQRLGEQTTTARDHKLGLLSRALAESGGYIAPFNPANSHPVQPTAIIPDDKFHKAQGEHLSALTAHEEPSLREAAQAGSETGLPQRAPATRPSGLLPNNTPVLASKTPTGVSGAGVSSGDPESQMATRAPSPAINDQTPIVNQPAEIAGYQTAPVMQSATTDQSLATDPVPQPAAYNLEPQPNDRSWLSRHHGVMAIGIFLMLFMLWTAFAAIQRAAFEPGTNFWQRWGNAITLGPAIVSPEVDDRGELVGPMGPQGPRGEKGEPGQDATAGIAGPTGPQGPAGEQGSSGPAGADGEDGCAGGTCVDLQDTTPGTQQTGHLNISGTGRFGDVVATTIQGNGGDITDINADNIDAGTLNDARLSTNVALLDAANSFSTVNSFTALGAADNNTLLCRNSSNQLATCTGGLAGDAFVQGGNSFGATAILGTNDAFDLAFETSGVTKWVIETDGDLVPQSNDDYDIGSDAFRVQDLYLGPATLHIGTSTTDEGTISYDTTGNILQFGTDATSGADIAFFTDDLYLDKSAGRVGIGTTSPLAGLNINVNNVATYGQLVVQDTSSGNTAVSYISFADADGTRRGFVGDAAGANDDISLQADTGNLHLGDSSGSNVLSLVLGNVGIGDASPEALLTVGLGDLFQVASDGNLRSSNAGSWTFVNDTNFILSGGTNGLSFDGTTLSIDATNDRVGIGTTAPNGKLEVAGSVSSASTIIGSVSSASTNFTVDHNTLSLINSDTTANNYVKIGFSDSADGTSNSAAIYGVFTDHTNNFGDIAFLTRSAGGFTEKLRIDSAGNVSFATLAAADNSTFLCRNSSNQLAGCSTTGTGAAFVQGGNSFGATAVLGTNDAFDLQFETGGSTKMTIQDSTGNVGIGETSPSSHLHINNSGDATITLGNNTGSVGTRAIKFSDNAFHQIVYNHDGSSANTVDWIEWGNIYFSPGGTSGNIGNDRKVAFLSSGNVGIGTTSPLSRLHAVDTGSGTRGLLVAQHSTNANSPVFDFRKSRGTEAAPAALANGDYAGIMRATVHDGTSYIQPAGITFRVNGAVATGSVPTDIIFGTGSGDDPGLTGNERMRINSSGNVGIGVVNPQNLLDIEGGAVIGASYSGTNTAPTNGLLVQGNVGIGTTTTNTNLEVLGGASARSAVRISSGSNQGAGTTLFSTDTNFTNPFSVSFGGGVGDFINADFVGNVSGYTSANGGLLLAGASDNASHHAMRFWAGMAASPTVANFQFNGFKDDGAGSSTALADTEQLISIQNNGTTKVNILGNGNLGIGVVNPQNLLDIEGGAVIGASYSGTNTAPTNGLLVQGNVGINTTTTSTNLHVTSSGGTSVQSVRLQGNSTRNTGISLFTTNTNFTNPLTTSYDNLAQGDFIDADFVGGMTLNDPVSGTVIFSGNSDHASASPMRFYGGHAASPNAAVFDFNGFKSDGAGSATALADTEKLFEITNQRIAKVTILGNGNLGIQDSTPAEALVVGSGEKFTVTSGGIASVNLNATASTNGICHSGANVDAATDTTRQLVACSGAPADIAEWYEVSGSASAGEIVTTTNESFTYKETQTDPWTGQVLPDKVTRTIAKLTRSSDPNQSNVIGVVSTSPFQVFGSDIKEQGDNPKPIALAGRVPVKVNTENGPIAAGDLITTSSVAGVGMKATEPGQVVGTALSDYSGSGTGTVMVFVNPHWYQPDPSEVLQTSNFTSLNVSGLATIEELKVTERVETVDLAITGHIAVSQDVGGEVTVPAGATSKSYAFKTAYAKLPLVTVTPHQDPGARYWVTRTKSGFTIHLSEPASSDVTFTYHSLEPN